MIGDSEISKYPISFLDNAKEDFNNARDYDTDGNDVALFKVTEEIIMEEKG